MERLTGRYGELIRLEKQSEDEQSQVCLQDGSSEHRPGKREGGLIGSQKGKRFPWITTGRVIDEKNESVTNWKAHQRTMS